MKKFFTIFGVVLLVVTGAGLVFAQTDAHMGTWKLNVAKSKFVPGPPIKSETRTYEPTGGGYKFSGGRVDADGTTHAEAFTVKYDGKDYPTTGDPSGADTLNVKLVDANHLDSTGKKEGKVVSTVSIVVSKDGKIMTMTSKGKNAKGESTNNVLVYDKQ